MPSSQSRVEREAATHPVAVAAKMFSARATSLFDTFEGLVNPLAQRVRSAEEELETFLRQQEDSEELVAADSSHSMPLTKQTAYIKLRLTRDDAHFSYDIVPRALLLALVAIYDHFVREHLLALYSIKPELRNAISFQFTVPELLEFESVEEAAHLVTERHLDTVLRENRLSQLKFMEKLLDMKLTDVKALPLFLEMIERRNIIAHCGGVVNDFYLKRCRDLGVHPGGEIGETLLVDKTYFESSFRAVFEIAIKLSQVTWRKLRPDELGVPDHVLRNITYNLLVLERYELAKVLLEFAASLRRHSSDHFARVFAVNLAQCYKWLGDQRRCEQVMAKRDWTAVDESFILADRVLHDDFDEAHMLMIRTGKNKSIPEEAFRDWPLFRRFRETDQFRLAYKEVYGREFNPGPFA